MLSRRKLLLGLSASWIGCGAGGRNLEAFLRRQPGPHRIALISASVSRQGFAIAGWSDEAAGNVNLRASLARPIAVLEQDFSRRFRVIPAASVAANSAYQALPSVDPLPHLTPLLEGHSLHVFTEGRQRLRATLPPEVAMQAAQALQTDYTAVMAARWGGRSGNYASVDVTLSIYDTLGELRGTGTSSGLSRLRTSGSHELHAYDVYPWVTAMGDAVHQLFPMR